MLSSKEKQLYECVKKLAPKVRHKCGLKNIEIDDLIQAGCIACLNEQTPQNEWPAVAKKAMLKWYYKEREWQQKTKTRDINIGKIDNNTRKNLVEDVIAAESPRTAAEQTEHDRTCKELADVEKLPLSAAWLQKAQDVIDKNGTPVLNATDWKHRRQTMRVLREAAQGTAEELTFAIAESQSKWGTKKPRRAFKAFMLRRAKLPETDEYMDKAKMALSCPLNRLCLAKIVTKEQLDLLCPPYGFVWTVEARKKERVKQHNRNAARCQVLHSLGLKHDARTRKILTAAQRCPLMDSVLHGGQLKAAFPALYTNKPRVRAGITNKTAALMQAALENT